MSNRGIARGRMFFGSFLLVAAVISWGTVAWLDPHSLQPTDGTDAVRDTVVTLIRNTAIGTLVLTALAGWMLFPPRRPGKPWRDRALIGIIAVLVMSSLYQLIWLKISGLS